MTLVVRYRGLWHVNCEIRNRDVGIAMWECSMRH